MWKTVIEDDGKWYIAAGQDVGPLVYVDKPTTIALPSRAERVTTEAEVLRRTREQIGRLDYATVWRNNVGSREPCRLCKPKLCPGCAMKFKHVVVYGLCEGSSDLAGIVECTVMIANGTTITIGRFFALELKRPGKKPTTEQLTFLAHVRSRGGYAGWADNVTDALRHVECARDISDRGYNNL